MEMYSLPVFVILKKIYNNTQNTKKDIVIGDWTAQSTVCPPFIHGCNSPPCLSQRKTVRCLELGTCTGKRLGLYACVCVFTEHYSFLLFYCTALLSLYFLQNVFMHLTFMLHTRIYVFFFIEKFIIYDLVLKPTSQCYIID